MTAQEISDLRLERSFELANLKADLLNMIDCKGENLLLIRKARLKIDELRDAIERDYYRFSKQARLCEEILNKENKRKQIEVLEAEIERIKREL